MSRGKRSSARYSRFRCSFLTLKYSFEHEQIYTYIYLQVSKHNVAVNELKKLDHPSCFQVVLKFHLPSHFFSLCFCVLHYLSCTYRVLHYLSCTYRVLHYHSSSKTISPLMNFRVLHYLLSH